MLNRQQKIHSCYENWPQGPRLHFKSAGAKLQYTGRHHGWRAKIFFGILTLYIAGKKIRIVTDNQVCLNKSNVENITNPMMKYLHLQTFHRRPYRLLQEL